MPLGFLVPAFLAGLAALLVPLVLHLRRRDRKQPRPFPSLMFLARVPVRTDQKRRITDWPLLLLRAAVVALLVGAFARPFLRDPTAITAPDAGLTVLLLDRSASAEAAGIREAWADSARAVIDRLPAGRRIAVVAFDATATILTPPSADHAAAIAAIATAPEPGGGTRFSAGLRAASQLLAAEQVPGEIVLVSDLQRTGLTGSGLPGLPAGTVLHTVQLEPTTRDNAAITSLDVEAVPGMSGRRAVAAARVARLGGDAPRNVEVTLEIDGRQAASEQVVLPADGVIRVTFDTTALATGETRLVARVSGDGFPLDDSRTTVIPADADVRVLLVAPRDARPDEYRFIEQALGIGRDPTFVVERVAALDRAALDRSAIVFLLDVAPPIGEIGEALEQWIRAGGGLIAAPGERLAGRRTEMTLLPVAMRGSRDRAGGAALGAVTAAHPALAAFQGDGGAALGGVHIRRHSAIEPEATAEVLVRYDDASPAVVATTQGAGRILVIGIPLDGRRGDFPLQPGFLPFLRGATGWAADAARSTTALESGEAWLAPVAIRSPVIRAPSGALIRPLAGSRFVNLREHGLHQVYDGGTSGLPLRTLAVNVPVSESDLAPAAPSDLLIGVGEIPLASTAPGEVAEVSEARQQGWRWVLLLLAALLVIETLIASRGWRGVAAPAVVTIDGEGARV